MAVISQTILSNAFLRMKSVAYCSKFHWSIGLDNGLASNRRQAIIWTYANPIHWRIYAALGGDGLKSEHNWNTSENPLHDYRPATEYRMMCVRFVAWIPAWISKYMISKVWDKTTCPFPKFNGTTIEVWEWIIKFTPHFTGHMITYPCTAALVHLHRGDRKVTRVSVGAPKDVGKCHEPRDNTVNHVNNTCGMSLTPWLHNAPLLWYTHTLTLCVPYGDPTGSMAVWRPTSLKHPNNNIMCSSGWYHSLHDCTTPLFFDTPKH